MRSIRATDSLDPSHRPSPGIEAVFSAHFQMLHDPALRFAGRFVSSDEAEDVVQTVFLRFWHQAVVDPSAGLPSDEARARAMVMRAVRNQAADVHRKARCFGRIAEPLAAHIAATFRSWLDPRLAARGDEVWAAVQYYMTVLSPRVSDCFFFVKLAGLTYADTADMLGIKPTTVRQHVVQANKSMREWLRDYLPDDATTPPATGRLPGHRSLSSARI